MNVPHAIDRATRMAETIGALDLGDRPIYFAPFSQVRDFSPRLAGRACLGWTFCTMDLTLRPWLIKRGQWQGRGFAAILRDDVLRCEADLLDVALHELAHGIERAAAPAAHLPEASLPRLLRVRPSDLPEHTNERQRAVDPRADLHFHSLRFIRTGLHVAWRASQAGYQPSLGMMNVAGRAYGLSRAQRYKTALGDEPRERETEPITTILQDRPPQTFSDLWQADQN